MPMEIKMTMMTPPLMTKTMSRLVVVIVPNGDDDNDDYFDDNSNDVGHSAPSNVDGGVELSGLSTTMMTMLMGMMIS